MPLRRLSRADLPMVLRWRNAPDVRNSMYSSHEIGEAEHIAWFARIENDARSRWFIYEDVAEVARGVVYFTDYREENRSSFWGFYTAFDATAGTGTGLGISALDHAFDSLAIHKLNAEVLASNTRSLAFHRKLGFSEEGVFRDFHFDGRVFVDVVRLGIIEDEWPVKRAELIERVSAR